MHIYTSMEHVWLDHILHHYSNLNKFKGYKLRISWKVRESDMGALVTKNKTTTQAPQQSCSCGDAPATTTYCATCWLCQDPNHCCPWKWLHCSAIFLILLHSRSKSALGVPHWRSLSHESPLSCKGGWESQHIASPLGNQDSECRNKPKKVCKKKKKKKARCHEHEECLLQNERPPEACLSSHPHPPLLAQDLGSEAFAVGSLRLSWRI